MTLEFIKKIDNYCVKGEYKKAYESINKYQLKNALSDKELLLLECKKCHLLRYLGEFEGLIESSLQLQAKAKELNNKTTQVDALLLEIFSHYRLNKVEHVLELIDQAEDLLSKLKKEDVPELKIRLLRYKVYACITNGNFEQAHKHAEDNFKLSKELNNPKFIATAYYINGWLHMHKGEMASAIENYTKSLKIREELNDNPYDLAHSLFGLGYVYRNLGELDNAFSCLNRCKKIREKIGNQQDIVWTILNLGDVYFAKNEIRNAQDCYDESTLISQSMDYTYGNIVSLRRLSSVYENLDEPQLVLDTLEKALDYSKKLEDVDSEVYSLFDLIKYILENQLESKEVNQYIARLRDINQRIKNKIFNLLYRLSQALLYKSKEDKRNQNKARNLFREIFEEEVIIFDYTRIAMQNYSVLLVEELKRYLSNDTLTNQLTNLSESINPTILHRSYTQVAENFIDLSQIALQEIDIKKARELLKNAQYFCDFLSLYNKGATPFKIIYNLFIKERSLNELSKNLRITKGALSSQLKLLIDLDIVRISREEQVRSATMLKKYYSLGNRGLDLIKPLNMKLCDCIKVEGNDTDYFINNLMKPRLLLKIIRDMTNFIDIFQDFLEEQIFLKPSESKVKNKETVVLKDIRKMITESSDIQIEQYLLTEKQYKIYKEYWKECRKKIQDEVIKEEIGSLKYHSEEKPIYVANLILPIKELMALERYFHKNKKTNCKDEAGEIE